MDFKLFFSTFLLIFLAELGDKTQLAAMARTATAESAKWTVFSAAAAALVFSTLIAVLVGSALTRVIPEHMIRMAAAILFILFGALLLRDALSRRAAYTKAAQPAETVATAPAGLLARVVLRAAAEFERAAAADYRQLAKAADTPQMVALFTSLAESEETHLKRLRHAGTRHGDAAISTNSVPSKTDENLRHDVAVGTVPAIEHAIHHEEATAAFYRALADNTTIPALQRIFLTLAAEEQQHADTLANAMTVPPTANS
jgi:rubrerythrin